MRRAGRYELLEILGRGATAIVWRARGPDGVEVAVKEMVLAATEESAREREVLGALACAGVPRVIERFVEHEHGHEVAFVVLELVDGEPLDRAIDRRRPTVAEGFAIAAEILDVLAGLHARGVVHRDVKPENVVRRRDGSLALVDLGSAALARDARPDARFTASGTIGYMPPEQLAGVVRPECDVYAVGALLVSILTRVHPSKLLDDRLALAWRGTGLALHPAQARLLDDLVARIDRRPGDARALAARAREVASLDPAVRSRSGAVAAAIALACGIVTAIALGGAAAREPEPEPIAPVSGASASAAPSPRPAPSRPALPAIRDPETGFEFRPLAPGPSACAPRGDCASIEHGALGIDLDAWCAREPSSAPGIVLTSARAFETTIHGEHVECTAQLDLPYACTVTCRHEIAGADPEALRARFEAHLQRTRDELGPERSASIQGLLDVYPRRQHQWSEGRQTIDLELDLASGCEPGSRDCGTALRTRITRMQP